MEIEKKPRKVQGTKLMMPLVMFGAGMLVMAGWSLMFDIKVVPNKNFLAAIRQGKVTPTPTPGVSAGDLESVVVPESGYEVKLKWGDIGQKLIESGAIDMKKFGDNYKDGSFEDELKYLTESRDGGI